MNARLRSQIYSVQKENSILVQQIIKLKADIKIKNQSESEESDEYKRKGSDMIQVSDSLVIDLRRANSYVFHKNIYFGFHIFLMIV